MILRFDHLFLEPDIPAKIFALVSEKDLHNVELVCRDWRRLVSERRLWGRKLQTYYNSYPEWRSLLQQNDWNPNVKLKHEDYKLLFKKIKILLGPEELTEDFLSTITYNFDLMNVIPSNYNTTDFYTTITNRSQSNLCIEEKIFIKRRHSDHKLLMSNIPMKTSQWLQCGLQMQKSSQRKIVLRHNGEHYPNLILFSPTAFPILVTSNGYVAGAGARYGRGKIVVVPQEVVNSQTDLMKGIISWCTNNSRCQVYVDPLTKVWTEFGWEYANSQTSYSFPITYMDRNELSKSTKIYITEGHYDDYADHLMEYVRNGGGLVIGAHPWWSGFDDIDVMNVLAGRTCSILEHPGNKIIARAGIVFSRERIREFEDRVHEDDDFVEKEEIDFQVDVVPALKYSLYYVLKACVLQPFSVYPEVIFYRLFTDYTVRHYTDYQDINLFSSQLVDNDYFKMILQYIKEVQKRNY